MFDPVCRGADTGIISVQVGFDGYYQLGRWSPIQVEFHSSNASNCRIDVVVPDPDGHPTRIALPADIDSDGNESTVQNLRSGLFRMGRLNQPIQVQLVEGNGVLDTFTVSVDDAEANQPLTTDSSLWLLVGGTQIFNDVPAWLVKSAADAERTLERNVVAVHRNDASLLPDSVEEYDSVDIVVIAGNYELTPAQSLALRQWVERGGRLVVSIGSRWAEYQANPIAEWSPIAADGGRPFSTLGPLTTLVTTTSGINLFYKIEGANLLPQGNFVLSQGSEGPLVIRGAYGLGTVTATSFDLDHEVILEWEPAPELALALAGMSDMAPLRYAGSAGGGDTLGSSHSELQTQLATVVDQYESVEPITNFFVLGLLTAYLVVIGMADYLLVHLWLKRPQLTWLTLPVWLTFGVLLTNAYGRSQSGSGDDARRVEVIDVVADTGQVRVHDWLALYSASPKRQSVREAVDSEWAGDGKVSLSWAGIPESGFRGMFRQSGLSFGDPDYAYNHETLGLSEFPRLPNASRVLEGEAWLTKTGLVESTLVDDGRGQLMGTFTHELPRPITDWFIAYRNSAYYPTEGVSIEPGEAFSVDRFPHPVIRSYLTRAAAQRSSSESGRTDVRMTRGDYDISADAHLDDVVRMISFHTAAGGTGYTSLRNNYLERFELTRLLDLNRAVVFGRLAESIVSLELDGKPAEAETVTFIRLVIPVDRR